MRIPVFPRGSNPSVHGPILRKSLAYCEDQVRLGNVEWIDRSDPKKGVMCLGLVDFGERMELVMPKFKPRHYEHKIEPRVEHLPSLDKLVSEWRCLAMYWNEAKT